MSVLDKLAAAKGKHDQVPNLELARTLAKTKDKKGIREIVDNLQNKSQGIQNDCIKVLYEIGAIDPKLIADYVPQFVPLLLSHNNRLVWGGMTALATVAAIRAQDIVANLAAILKAFDSGTVITVDNGVRVLARAASKPAYNKRLFPYLLDHLKNCRPKEIPQHSESSLPAVTAENKKRFITVLNARLDILTPTQAARVRKIIKTAESR